MFHHFLDILNAAIEQISQAVQPNQPERTRPSVNPISPTASVTPMTGTQRCAAIPRGAYKDRTDLTEFTVPEGVTYIGIDAFLNCRNLEKVILPESLLEIDYRAFCGCASLKEIRIPDSVSKIGGAAFSECSMLHSFRFPAGMRGKTIPPGIFYRCTSLESVELPDRAAGQFSNVFQHCSCLRSVKLPAGITEIGSFTFKDCDMLESIEIPDGVAVLEYKAFLSCKNLREVYVPDSVKIIDIYRTFADCSKLERIRLPIGVQFRHVFNDDETNGIAGCFDGCTRLHTVYYGSQTFALAGILNDAEMQRMNQAVGAESRQPAWAAKTAEPWDERPPLAVQTVVGGFSDLPETPAKTIAAVESSDKTYIPPEKYMGREDLTEFTVPNGVTVIGNKAFQKCVNLEKITLPEGLREIGICAFDGCVSLREIRIPDSVVRMGNHAFSGCKKLTHFRFPAGMRGAKVEVGMFYDCTSLETAELPDMLTGEFENVFPDCENLRSVTLPEGITTIGSFTFQYCKQITEIAIPSTVTHIEYKAFLGCGIREIFIPDNVKEIDIYCTFADCAALERIRLPIGVEFKHVFKDKDELGGIANCFHDCEKLKTVYLGSRPFELEGKFNDDALLMMYTELAAEGDVDACRIVQQDMERAMELLTLAKNHRTMRAILNRFDQNTLTAEILKAAAECAEQNGAEEVLFVLRAHMHMRGIK